jgi:hypothetical protein
MSNSGDNGTIETMTFIAADESKASRVKEGVQATGTWRTMEVRCRLVCVRMSSSREFNRRIRRRV